MATTYLSPGVYVEVVDTGTKPIEVLGPSTPAFLGITAQASKKLPQTGAPDPDGSVLEEAQLVTNWTQYKTLFGGFVKGAYLPDAIYGYFDNGGGPCYVTSLQAVHEDYSRNAKKASCSIPAEGTNKDKSKEKDVSFVVETKVGGLYGNECKVFIDLDLDDKDNPTGKFTMRVMFPGMIGDVVEKKEGLTIKDKKILTTIKNPDGTLQEVAFESVNITQVSGKPPQRTPKNQNNYPEPYKLSLPSAQSKEVTIKPLSARKIKGDSTARKGLDGLEVLDDVRLIVCPDLMAGLPLDSKPTDGDKERIIAVQQAMVAQCLKLKYRFAILDTPPNLDAKEVKAWRNDLGIGGTEGSYAALYYPWLKIADLSGNNGRTKFTPPSGIMAGVYNRVDGTRGVHKAPANEAPLGVIGLQHELTQGEQDTLNPHGINCLRSFPGGRGIKIWGARTLSTEGAWRYINVRRLFITVAASLDAGLQWVVFEPNDRALWARVRRDINAFLSTFWLNGALFGSSKSEAFYVKCDDELNPPAIRDLGQLIIEVGMCPVKPAEFVILRLSQWAGPNAESE